MLAFLAGALSHPWGIETGKSKIFLAGNRTVLSSDSGKEGRGEMAQGLRALAALPEDTDLILSPTW